VRYSFPFERPWIADFLLFYTFPLFLLCGPNIAPLASLSLFWGCGFSSSGNFLYHIASFPPSPSLDFFVFLPSFPFLPGTRNPLFRFAVLSFVVFFCSVPIFRSGSFFVKTGSLLFRRFLLTCRLVFLPWDVVPKESPFLVSLPPPVLLLRNPVSFVCPSQFCDLLAISPPHQGFFAPFFHFNFQPIFSPSYFSFGLIFFFFRQFLPPYFPQASTDPPPVWFDSSFPPRFGVFFIPFLSFSLAC